MRPERWFSKLSFWLPLLLHRREVDQELDDEIRYHIEAKAEENIAKGMAPEEARRDAGIELGGAEQVKERVRSVRTGAWLETFLQDVRFGLHMLRKNPGFTVVAILILALGIGANTAIFSVVNGVLLNPLPYPNPDRLVTVDASKPNFPRGSISYPNFLDWHRINHCFSFFAVSRPTGYLLTGVGSSEELGAAAISSDFFPMLGIKPVLGRSFTPEEDRIAATDVVAISTDLWHRKFGSSPNVIGKSISLDGRGYIIVDVFPGHFDLPMRYFGSVDIYSPLGEFRNSNIINRVAGLGIHGIARLRPGITVGQARSEMRRVTDYTARTYPDADKGLGATLTPLKESIVGRVRSFLLLLLGAVGVVLLIACVNIANLLLVRGNARRREVAIRSALGASTPRLARQMLTESVLVALIGGALGLGFAAAGTRAALASLPATLPRVDEVGIDARVLWFTVLVSILAGILFGLIPAFRVARGKTYEMLKEGSRAIAGSRHRTQHVLVTVQMALALVLLAGAGLLIRSLAQLWNVSPGFDPNGVVEFNLALPPEFSSASPEAIRTALRNFDAAMAAIPGVQAESLSWGAIPLYEEDDEYFWIEGEPRPASENQMHDMLDYIVGPDYLKAMHIPLIAGRFFSRVDNEHSKPVVVVDDVFAKKYFPNCDAVGRMIYQGDKTHTFPFEIVGVVGHVNQWGLDTDSENSLRAQVYFPFMQMPDNVMSLVPSNTEVIVRSSGNILGLIGSIRAASSRLSGDEAVTGFETLHQIVEASLAPRRFAMMLLGSFATLALVLAGIGLYGVIAYAVGQRTHEIGIRIALGAHPRDVFRMIVGQGFRTALTGVFIGTAAVLVLVRLVSSFTQLLYGVGASDPATLISVAIVLLVVALLACYIPARRAVRVDPMIVLRCE